jgi:hypothetical protein
MDAFRRLGDIRGFIQDAMEEDQQHVQAVTSVQCQDAQIHELQKKGQIPEAENATLRSDVDDLKKAQKGLHEVPSPTNLGVATES